MKGHALHASQAVLWRLCGLGADNRHHWRHVACMRRAGCELSMRSVAAEAPAVFPRLARREEAERDEMSKRGGLRRASLEADLLGRTAMGSGDPLNSGLHRTIRSRGQILVTVAVSELLCTTRQRAPTFSTFTNCYHTRDSQSTTRIDGLAAYAHSQRRETQGAAHGASPTNSALQRGR